MTGESSMGYLDLEGAEVIKSKEREREETEGRQEG